ncbi:MAG: aminoacyl-tRNA hydrolase [Candidatus Wildermuthbacteria bacterium]|nr:aminoacyl-tRNA hydrolase [Candidatus Wildermuthbacteria bacterium]
MVFIVGLGNPGIKYANTPHNAGFMALDAFAKVNGFPPFKLSKKHSSLISERILDSRLRQGFGGQAVKVVLAKPQTLMNNSGKAVTSLVSLPRASFAKLALGKELIVVHDDIDIPLGKIKVSKGSGSAGHKGVESIMQALGTKAFTRIRIGIQPATGKPENVEDFVLNPLQKTESLLLQSSIQKSLEALHILLSS